MGWKYMGYSPPPSPRSPGEYDRLDPNRLLNESVRTRPLLVRPVGNYWNAVFWFSILAVLLWGFTGCTTITKPPKLAPRTPWYTTEPNLQKKAEIVHKETMEQVTESGLLLYRSFFPWDEKNYNYSHNLPDQPAWHGHLMAALAFEMAVTDTDRSEEISHLANGLLTYYEVTGIPGLFGRAVMPEYSGPRIDAWMLTKEHSPTRYWLQGTGGRWWRNGCAKNHLNSAIFGCAVPLALARAGDIRLDTAIQRQLASVVIPAVFRLVSNDFQIIDFDGKPTEFGNLGPQVANGFNMIVVLHMMKTAASIPEDLCTQVQWQQVQEIAAKYEEVAQDWATKFGLFGQALGDAVVKIVGHRRGKWDKPSFSDMSAIATSFISLVLQEDRREIMKSLRHGMEGLWRFVKYERNPLFAYPYVALVRPDEFGWLAGITQDLRDYPIDKYDAATDGVDTDYIQPLANRPMVSNYWRMSPFRILKYPPQPRDTPNLPDYSCQDFTLGFYLGRYYSKKAGLELVPEE